MPHGHCYLWNPSLVALHVVSDALTALAYTSIPFTLLHLVRKRQDVPFNWMYLCFGAFIVACGLTHAMEIWTLWTPSYWLSGAIKAVTAVASVSTAILLVRLVPRALAIPSANELADAHAALRKAHEVLERRVAERTAEVTKREADLRESAARKTAMMEASLDAIIVTDRHGTILEFNAAAERTFGRRLPDVVGKSLADVIVPPRLQARYRAILARYLEEGTSELLGKRLETEALRSDGTEFPVEVAVIRFEAGGAPMLAAYVRDISERRRTAEALKLSEQRFRRLGESGIVGLIVGTDEGVVVEANDAFLSMSGYTREDLESGAIQQRALNLPEWAGEQARAVKQLAETGSIKPWEKEFRRKDGSRVPVLLAVTSVEPPNILSVVLDLTALKQAEATVRDLRALREADATIRALLEAAPDAMVIVDRAGDIVLINAQAEKLFGYRRTELIGQPLDRLVPERFRAAHRGHRKNYFEDARAREMGLGLDLFALRKDGTEFPVEISLSPLETKQGLLVSSAIRDITERRRAEQELRQTKDAAEAANRELEAFSYSVAHDLRSPLRAINGFAVALTEDFADALPAEGKEFLERISSGAGRMGQLIDALLALSRVSRTTLAVAPVNLSDLASSIVTQLRANEPGRTAEVVIAPDLVAEGDPSLLRAALENLLGNAWKFGSKTEALKIEFGRVTVSNGVTAFFVRDNGAGFDMEYAGKLFAPFQRLHGMSEFSGTGIGLATVQRIVSRHGGRVWAEGTVDRGATFYFTLHDPRGEST
jgi:PAS domain S-box-containing protein